MSTVETSAGLPRSRPRAVELPAEGADGLFSQSWFPICLSTDVGTGQVRGYPFLDGRVVVVRGEDGVATVLSPYCPHMGADLAVGSVVGNSIRCAFHHWRYDTAGRCIATGPGDPPPPAARLFRFPTEERYGLVWAFNGIEPLFDIPGFPFPDEALIWRTEQYRVDFDVDPWVICCNTPDIQHIRVVHRIAFDSPDPGAGADWTPYSMFFDAPGTHAHGERIDFRVGIVGTSIFCQSGEYLGRWFGFSSPMCILAPGRTRLYLTVAVKRSEPDAEAYLESMLELERRVVGEDEAILQTIRFRPGTLTATDRTLSRFFDHLRRYPRAHPSQDFIR
jgi:nitrite reductase/ring-hydroxylating ferredoxin subunit